MVTTYFAETRGWPFLAGTNPACVHKSGMWIHDA